MSEQPRLATEETYLRAVDGTSPEARPQRALISFVAGGETYGLEIARIREIIKVTEITEVPRVPRFLIGILSVRGVVIPVLDLRLRLGLDATPPTRAARILVVVHNGEPFGLLVDSVAGVARLRESEIEPVPPTLAGGDTAFLAGIGRLRDARRGRIVILLDLAQVLAFEVGGAR
jgi:purine-binding chemotaxis protein CheW